MTDVRPSLTAALSRLAVWSGRVRDRMQDTARALQSDAATLRDVGATDDERAAAAERASVRALVVAHAAAGVVARIHSLTALMWDR